MFSKKNELRISKLENELRELSLRYKDLLRHRDDFSNSLKRVFDSELAAYRAAAQATQTDRIKFGVLEEWINDVFKLNGLKFSDKDFIEKSEEQMLREKIAQEIELWNIDSDASEPDKVKFEIARDVFAKVARGKK